MVCLRAKGAWGSWGVKLFPDDMNATEAWNEKWRNVCTMRKGGLEMAPQEKAGLGGGRCSLQGRAASSQVGG